MNDNAESPTPQQYNDKIWNAFTLRQLKGLEQIFTNDKRPCTTGWQTQPMSQRDGRAEFTRALSRVGAMPVGRAARYGAYGPVGLGIPLGINGLICIDIDPRNFKPAIGVDVDFFQNLLDGGWENWLGKAYIEHTPTGGLHLIFRMPTNWEPSPRGIAVLKEVGIDYLFGEHQVVVAPTERPDGIYEPELGEGCLDIHEYESLLPLPDEFTSRVPAGDTTKAYKPFAQMNQSEQEVIVRSLLSISPQSFVDAEASWVNTAFALGTWQHPEAFKVFDDWSRRSPKYESDAAIELWQRVTTEEAVNKPNGRKLPHLFYDAAVGEWGDKQIRKSHVKMLFPKQKDAEQVGANEAEWSDENPMPQVQRLVAMEIAAGRYWIRSGVSELKLFDAETGKGFVIVANDKSAYDTALNGIAWKYGMHTITDKRAAKSALETELDAWWRSFCSGDASYNVLPKDTWIDYAAGCDFVSRNNLGEMPPDGADHVWVQSKDGLLNCTLRKIYPFNPFFIPNSELQISFAPNAPDADDFLLGWIKLWAKDDAIALKYLEIKREFLASAFLGTAVKACEFFYGETNIGKTGFYAVMMNTLFGVNSYQIMTREEFLGERWPSDILGKRVVIVDEVLGARHTDEMVVASIKNKVTSEPVVALNLKFAGHLRAAFTPTWVFTFNRYSKFFLDAAIEQRAILVEGMPLKDDNGERDDENSLSDTRIAHFFGQIERDPELPTMILNSILKAKCFKRSNVRKEHLVDVMTELRSSVAGQKSMLIAEESPLAVFINEWLTPGDGLDFISGEKLYSAYLEYLKTKENKLSRSHLEDLRRFGKSKVTFGKQLAGALNNSEWEHIKKSSVRGSDGKVHRGWFGLRLSAEANLNCPTSVDEALTDTEGLTI